MRVSFRRSAPEILWLFSSTDNRRFRLCKGRLIQGTDPVTGGSEDSEMPKLTREGNTGENKWTIGTAPSPERLSGFQRAGYELSKLRNTGAVEAALSDNNGIKPEINELRS